VHELTTNAAKYGALSVPGGRIEIHWRPVRGEDGRLQLRIDWAEQGGPSVAAPKQSGFGSKLIEGSIAAELGGSARLAFVPEGLRCEILIPIEIAAIDTRTKTGEDWSV
jgi:two-component sensor histidine kinase